jgi:hypothetical protein
MGGTRDRYINQPPNLVWICQACHADIESHRENSYRDGWLARRGRDAAAVPLITLDDRMIMLGYQGSAMIIDSLAGINEGPTPW